MVRGMNTFSKKFPLENMNGKNTWGSKAAEKTVAVSLYYNYQIFCGVFF